MHPLRLNLILILIFLQLFYGASQNNNVESLMQSLSKENMKLQNDVIDLGKTHRHNLNKNNIRFEKGKIIIEVNARRTNIQSTLIKTYWMCGYALSNNNLPNSQVIVILNISKRNNILISIANGLDVVELGRHELSDYAYSTKFLDKLTVYKQK